MNYTLRFFTHEKDREKFLMEQEYQNIPFIPRKNDLIFIDDEEYIVKQVVVSYDNESNQVFEIMIEVFNYDKEWWE